VGMRMVIGFLIGVIVAFFVSISTLNNLLNKYANNGYMSINGIIYEIKKIEKEK
jgi:hypothetical protein